jgi:hypothetical protein
LPAAIEVGKDEGELLSQVRTGHAVLELVQRLAAVVDGEHAARRPPVLDELAAAGPDRDDDLAREIIESK